MECLLRLGLIGTIMSMRARMATLISALKVPLMVVPLAPRKVVHTETIRRNVLSRRKTHVMMNSARRMVPARSVLSTRRLNPSTAMFWKFVAERWLFLPLQFPFQPIRLGLSIFVPVDRLAGLRLRTSGIWIFCIRASFLDMRGVNADFELV
jgi:hypothetical protein